MVRLPRGQSSFPARMAAGLAGALPAGRSRAPSHYEFSRNPHKSYLLERMKLFFNLLTLYQLRTWLVLWPALLVFELLMLAYSARDGWMREKLRGYAWIARHPDVVRRRRRWAQRQRMKPDAELAPMSGEPLRLRQRRVSGASASSTRCWRATGGSRAGCCDTVTDVPDDRVLVVIPALNEQDTVGDVIKQVGVVLPDAHILVVDDGSTDRTPATSPGRRVRTSSACRSTSGWAGPFASGRLPLCGALRLLRRRPGRRRWAARHQPSPPALLSCTGRRRPGHRHAVRRFTALRRPAGVGSWSMRVLAHSLSRAGTSAR